MGPPDGQQDMAGVQGAGGAGRAGGGADAPVVQQQEQALPLDALKAEVHIAGKPTHRVAVEGGVGNLRQPRNQSVPQGGHLRVIIGCTIEKLVFENPDIRKELSGFKEFVREYKEAEDYCYYVEVKKQDRRKGIVYETYYKTGEYCIFNTRKTCFMFKSYGCSGYYYGTRRG